MAFTLRLDPDLDAALTANHAATGVPKIVTVRRALERELGLDGARCICWASRERDPKCPAGPGVCHGLDPENRVRSGSAGEGREVAGRGESEPPSGHAVESGPRGRPSSPRPATSSPKFKPDFKKEKR